LKIGGAIVFSRRVAPGISGRENLSLTGIRRECAQEKDQVSGQGSRETGGRSLIIARARSSTEKGGDR